MKDIIKKLLDLKDDENARHLSKFYKTGKGQYSEHDKFLGINVPKVREFVKKNYGLVSLEQIPDILHNEYHEIRLFALLMLVMIFEKEVDKKEKVVQIYLDNTEYINNWDLVDLSAPKIIGRYCFDKNNYSIVEKLANKKHLWSQRIAIVSQWYPIKQGKYSTALKLCEKFLKHEHDLIHKACGWMLREIGKKDINTLYNFLDKYNKVMPRVMLRYSLEKLSQEKRKYYM